MIRASNQAAPDDDWEKDFQANWKFDLYKTKQGNGYISSAFWTGVNGTTMFKASMMMERCGFLTTAAMMAETSWLIKNCFDSAVATASAMIPNFQRERPDQSDRNFQTKARTWAFQEDITNYYKQYVFADRVEGKIHKIIKIFSNN